MVRNCLASVALLAAMASSPVEARPDHASFVRLGAVADAPNGFTELCARDSRWCGVEPVPSLLPTVDPAVQSAPPAVAPAIPGLFHSALIADEPVKHADAIPVEVWHGTSSTRRLVRQINAGVNHRVVQRSDLDRFGVEERWEPTGPGDRAIGDCEDIALEKQAELLAAGVPATRLLLATVFKPHVGLHTILVVRLDDGDVVLDSLTSRIRPWYRTPYVWLRVQSPDNRQAWRAVEHA